MGLIFFMSAQPADESSAQSSVAAQLIGHIFVDGFDEMPAEEQTAYCESIMTPVRKCAHFTEYFVLGGLMLLVIGHEEKRRWLISLVFCAVYAEADEFHQLFVEGRACRFLDVCIDSAGSLTGILITALGIYIVRKIIKKREAT